jgi:hypothetical protein
MEEKQSRITQMVQKYGVTEDEAKILEHLSEGTELYASLGHVYL